MCPSLRPLESLKGFPLQIRPTIECVGANENLEEGIRWERLRECLAPRLLALPSRFKVPKVDNLISAQALPTAARLNLIGGGRGDWRLTYYGHRLLEVSDDPDRFTLRLGKAILEFDTEKCHVVEALKVVERHPGYQVPRVDLAIALAAFGVDAMEDLSSEVSTVSKKQLDGAGVTWRTRASRLSDLLQFYDWVDLLRYRKGSVTLLHSRIGDIEAEEIERPLGTVSFGEFHEMLTREYDSLAQEIYRSPFVPIKPRLIESVCKKLQIGEKHFTKLLLQLPNVYRDRQILLSPYRHPRPTREVVQDGKRQYYFISMYTLDQEGALDQGGDES